MPPFRIVVTDGSEHEARSFALEGASLRIALAEGGGVAVPLAQVDLARTVAANSGVDFGTWAPRGMDLEVERGPGENRGDHLVVEGRVRNRGPEATGEFVARVVARDGGGRLAASEEALVDGTPLAPGEEALFRVVLRAPMPVAETQITFRNLMGGAAPTRLPG